MLDDNPVFLGLGAKIEEWIGDRLGEEPALGYVPAKVTVPGRVSQSGREPR